MNRLTLIVSMVLVLLALSGCSRDAVYRNLYEGMRVQSELQRFPEDNRKEQNPISYDQYKREQEQRRAEAAEQQNR